MNSPGLWSMYFFILYNLWRLIYFKAKEQHVDEAEHAGYFFDIKKKKRIFNGWVSS